MPDEHQRPVGWSIGYGDFFLSKLRRKLLPLLEMPAARRPFRLFSTSNDVISTHIRAGGAFEAETLGMIDAVAERHALKQGVALDIGANIGNHAVWMAQRFGEVVAFEPNPIIASVLRANAMLNQCTNMHVVETALSDHEGTAMLVARRGDHIGTLELDEHGTSAGNSIPAARVALQTGDSVLESLRLSTAPVTFIKMDIEGAEVQALAGLDRTLRRDHPVICFEARNPVEGEAVRERLRQAGYSRFFAVHASRLVLLQLLNPRTWISWTKRYSLVPLEAFEDKHYAAVFAWTRDLR